MEQQLELFVTTESQEKLEQEIKIALFKTRELLYTETGSEAMSAYGILASTQRKIIEYFDNTRLLQNQPKEKVEL